MVQSFHEKWLVESSFFAETILRKPGRNPKRGARRLWVTSLVCVSTLRLCERSEDPDASRMQSEETYTCACSRAKTVLVCQQSHGRSDRAWLVRLGRDRKGPRR